ncbi:LysR family transcriptional regulator [Marinibaculum pumilum]|uniref:LysR family transcriptional regulator n=1 Tax=Marinibaculum pumilum TaxID=1766165 RepID=A0ABV7L923_9PROT
MDVELARTFLAVIDSGSFVEAAARLHVTQSTVSMRVKTLEAQLGKTLFERNKSGATLTAAGQQFQKHALAFVRVWQQARLEVSLPAGYDAALTVGGTYSLWDGFLLPWVTRMRRSAPAIAIRTELGTSAALMQHLVGGMLDVGVMYTPERRPGLEVELLFEERLVLVSSEKRSRGRAGQGYLGRNYVYIDWGPEFQADHGLAFPDLSTPGLYMELGSLGLDYLLANPASGYFPHRLAAPHLASGALRLVAQAPVFAYPAYMVFPQDAAGSGLERALRTLRRSAAQLAEG